MNLKNTKIKQEDGSNLMSYQAHLFVALTIGFIGTIFCISLYQMNKVKQAQIFLFLTIKLTSISSPHIEFLYLAL